MGQTGPHPGQDLGLVKCLYKGPTGDGSIFVVFHGEQGTASFSLQPERAEYFVVGQSYDFWAKRP